MEVVFNKPKYRVRLFAFLFDLLCMSILGVLLVFATQAIMNNVPYYKEANQNINEIQLASGLYVERDDHTTKLMCDHYKIEKQEQYEEYNKKFDVALTYFYSNERFFDSGDPHSGLYLYNIEKIPEGQNDSKLFIYADESHTSIEEKSDASKVDLYNFYCKIMSEKAVKYVINSDAYIKNSRTISLTFVFITLLIPILLSVLVFEFVMPLIFKRGRKTFGKLLFKLSVVDARGLNCSFWRFLARFSIFLILEVLVGIVSFAIPLIVSFSMMVFSKTSQAFHDYVSGTYVVEAPMTSICITQEEYLAKVKKDSKFVLNKEDISYE